MRLLAATVMAAALLRACNPAPPPPPPPPPVVLQDTMHWDPVAGVAGYRIYRAPCLGTVDPAAQSCSQEGAFFLVEPPDCPLPCFFPILQSTRYVDATVQHGDKWVYYLVSVSNLNIESDPSKHLAAEIP